MKDILGHEKLWYPFKAFGYTHPFFAVNLQTLYYTWVAMAAIIFFILIGRIFLPKTKTGTFIIKSIGKSFIALVEQSIGKLVERYYLYIGSLFLFILVCNWIAIIPYIEEPTKDLNTTLSLGISSFLYAQKESIKTHGIIHYLKEYFLPFSIMFPFNIIAGLIVLPLKLLAEFAGVISLSFRLFGNIFGGAMIMAIYQKFIAGSIILNIITIGLGLIITAFFIIFEGFLQALVFSILTLTTITMVTQKDAESPLT